MNVVDEDAYELVEVLWAPSLGKRRLFNGDPVRNVSMEAYSEYYKTQFHLIAGHGGGHYVALQTPQEIDEPRQDTLASLRPKCASDGAAADEACENTINLAARLLLMLKIGLVRGQSVPRRCLSWTQGSLRSFVRTYFAEPPRLNSDHLRLPKTFDAWSIATIGGIAVDFTDNLADHLLLVADDSKVLIFHHASFLEHQQESLFPEGLVDETLRTLALLFPQHEFGGTQGNRSSHSKRAWLRALQQQHPGIDGRLTLCGSLQAEDRQIEHFYFWRDRLVILK
ncbi:hypothetical protein GQ53DRAFT_824798 [Thozetella sp. PMI_491]|nr:hypothetical protein GQ53DRAFT_824798 [Thozetella sp. PMI_491]